MTKEEIYNERIFILRNTAPNKTNYDKILELIYKLIIEEKKSL